MKRTDNMPTKLTAHAVRRLTICTLCGGMGDRSLMITGNTHTSCFAEKFGFKGITQLGSEAGKFRLDDISRFTTQQQRAIIAQADQPTISRYPHETLAD